LHRMQVVQNAGAWFVTDARTTEHTTPVLCELHWLPDWQKLLFWRIIRACMACHAMLSHLRWSRLTSAVTGQLAVPCTKITYGD